MRHLESKLLKVYESANYDAFSRWVDSESKNREIRKNKVAQLMQSISKIGVIRAVVCAEVGKKLYILDGQHLFEALKSLSLPIVYTVMKVPVQDIPATISWLNNTQLRWDLKDYLLIHQDKPAYRGFALKEAEYKPLSLNAKVRIYGNNQAESKFKSGTYEFFDSELNDSIASTLALCKQYKVSAHRRFDAAVEYLIREGVGSEAIHLAVRDLEESKDNLPTLKDEVIDYIRERVQRVSTVMNLNKEAA